MKNWLLKNSLAFLGIVCGGLLGYAYYYFIGCSSGTCAITSKPVNSSLYGMVMGYLILTSFQKNKNNTNA